MELQISLIEQSFNSIMSEVNYFKDRMSSKLDELRQTKEGFMSQVKLELEKVQT